jgi:lipopolysaccharide biosynthesis glycosyltransferase
MHSNPLVSIAIACDDNYARYAGVALASIFENQKSKYDCVIYILENALSTTNKTNLQSIARHYHAVIHFLKADVNKFQDLKLTEYYTTTAYLRLDLPNLLLNLDKILYFDCDMIVRRDIWELWQIDISNHYMAASGDSSTFNSGLMLINLKRWRDDNITSMVVNYIRNHPDNIKHVDQDGLNYIFSNKPWKLLPIRWNVRAGQQQAYNNMATRKIISKEHAIAARDPFIVHYTGDLKPSDYNYTFVYNFIHDYIKYKKHTPWRFEKLNNYTIENAIKSMCVRMRRYIADKYYTYCILKDY